MCMRLVEFMLFLLGKIFLILSFALSVSDMLFPWNYALFVVSIGLLMPFIMEIELDALTFK